MSELPVLSPAKIDFNDATRTVLMQKNADLPYLVRTAVPGEEMISGEVAKEGYVAILHPDFQQEKPLYCMSEDEFRAESIPAVSNQIASINDIPTLWFVEARPKRVYFVPSSEGPFHLEAPTAWNVDKDNDSGEEHPGWDVSEKLSVETTDGRIIEGYPVVESPQGPMYDKQAIEAGSYKVAPKPR